MKMKKTIKTLTLPLLCALTLVFAAGCSDNADSSSSSAAQTTTVSSESPAVESSSSESESSVSESGESEASSENSAASDDALWGTAVYTEDTEIGEGAVTVKVEVAAGDKSITFTVHTDKKNLGDALTENKLVSGDDSEYGLYIKEVNGIKADYDTDKAYWAISKDGEYLQTGADSTEIADGEHYELTYTKG